MARSQIDRWEDFDRCQLCATILKKNQEFYCTAHEPDDDDVRLFDD